MKKSIKNSAIGFAAGIISGAAYGFNPLFAKSLLVNGTSVYSMLFFRYLIATAILALWMLVKRESFRICVSQIPYIVLLGLCYGGSSIGLFVAYKYIPAGLATTLIYQYPIFTALIMVFLHRYPSWQVWLSIIITVAGVILLCIPSEGVVLNLAGVLLSVSGALLYAIYLVVVNNSRAIASVSPHTLTFHVLSIGALLFLAFAFFRGENLLHGIEGWQGWGNIVGLAIIPTMISTLTIAISTRRIGATKTAVLGVFDPITAILIGTLAFCEPLTSTMTAGICICIAAVLFMILSHRR